jgi:hypothetical protein
MNLYAFTLHTPEDRPPRADQVVLNGGPGEGVFGLIHAFKDDAAAAAFLRSKVEAAMRWSAGMYPRGTFWTAWRISSIEGSTGVVYQVKDPRGLEVAP